VSNPEENSFHLALVEDKLWVATYPVGMSRYDFAFEQFFACRHPMPREGTATAVARMGAATDYEQRYDQMAALNVRLIHTPEEYRRTSELPIWYPLIADLTARSVWFEKPPSSSEIMSQFKWPVFVRGGRQTNRHQRHLSILEGPADFERVMEWWDADPILHWQPVVCREFIPLRLVGEQSPGVMPRAFEFRSFWWKDQCVGIGPYWMDEHYELTSVEKSAALVLGGEVARRLNVTFLVVDLAQRIDGTWIVIECNDGQDSGYAGVAPFLLWRKVLDII